jgi:hypothetical protein
MSFKAKQINPDNGSLTVILGNKPYKVDNSHENYDVLLNAFHTDDTELWLENIDIKKAVEKYIVQGGLEVRDDSLMYKGEVLNDRLSQTILEMKRNGQPIDYMVNLLENILKNPSMQSRRQIYDFLKHKDLPITPDGCFVAYKAVTSDFYSKSAGKLVLLQGSANEAGHIFNGVGQVVECERADVDDDRRNQCSYGLHVGALSYSGPNGNFFSHGDVTVLVKVNPADVIAVPEDYDATKMRVCKYEVIGVYERPLSETVYGEEDILKQNAYRSREAILAEYDYEDEDEFSSPFENICEDDRILLKDCTGRMEHEVYGVVTSVDYDMIVVKVNGEYLEVTDEDIDDGSFEIVEVFSDL